MDLFRKDMPGLSDEVVTVQDFAWSEQPWIRAARQLDPSAKPEAEPSLRQVITA